MCLLEQSNQICVMPELLKITNFVIFVIYINQSTYVRKPG